MVATDLKAETVKLMDKREAIEAEMNSIIQRLTLSGGPGLLGNLLDSEGFPRADVDIPVVRAGRHRLSELRNDHKDITKRIDENLQALHSHRLSPVSTLANASVDAIETDLGFFVGNAATSAPPPTSRADDMNVNFLTRRPFALVDEIIEGSPAADDGLQLGDQIVKFGNVESGRQFAAEAFFGSSIKCGKSYKINGNEARGGHESLGDPQNLARKGPTRVPLPHYLRHSVPASGSRKC